ncbi:HD domain-containing protein, partial [Francisella tularensis]|uniref:HD domain-containing protein n=1 Tax=Francisella tularensis TaxID=263 RepID=UPI002381BE89
GADAHATHVRSAGEPYFTHPVAVACILAELRMDVDPIIAALLHDVVEDTEYTVDDISNIFGQKVAQLVEGVTKLTQI